MAGYVLFKNENGEVYTRNIYNTADVVDIFNDNSIYAFYKLDGNALDSSPFGYNGSEVNAVYTDGIFNQCLQGTGSDKINIPFDILGGVAANVTFPVTFSAWVYTNKVTGANPILQFGGTSNALALGIVDGKARIIAQRSNIFYYCDSDISLDTNQWYHIVGVYVPYSQLRIYVNGVLHGTTTLSSTFVANTGSWEACIGAVLNRQFALIDSNTVGYNYNNIDQVRIFRRNCTDDEVKQIDSVYYDPTEPWTLVKSDYTTLVEDDFVNNGISTTFPITFDKSIYQQIGNNIDILLYDNTLTLDTEADIDIKFDPTYKLVIQKVPTDLHFYTSLNMINVLGTGVADIKVVFSKDGINWYTFNTDTREWTLVKSEALDYTNKDDVDLIINNGISYQDLNATGITPNTTDWSNFFGGEPTQLYIAFVINCDAANPMSVSQFALNVTPKENYKDVTSDVDIYQANDVIVINLSEDGVYKINYID